MTLLKVKDHQIDTFFGPYKHPITFFHLKPTYPPSFLRAESDEVSPVERKRFVRSQTFPKSLSRKPMDVRVPSRSMLCISTIRTRGYASRFFIFYFFPKLSRAVAATGKGFRSPSRDML